MDQQQASSPAPLSLEQAQAFWSAFAAQQAAFASLPAVEVVEQGNALLAQHVPGLSLEVLSSTGDEGQPHELVLTAHGQIEHFERLLQLVQAAPALPGYRVTAFRARLGGGGFAMRMNDFELAMSDVQVAHYDAGGTVGLELKFLKPIPMDMLDHARHMAFILLDHVLGEYDFAVRVGPVDFVDDLAQGVGLPELPVVFDAFLHDALGRTGQAPDAQNTQWMMAEWEDDDGEPVLLLFNRSACSVATRADLATALRVTAHFDDQHGFDAVRDAEDQIAEMLALHHTGLLVWGKTQVHQGVRESQFYVSDEPAARAAIEQALGARQISASIDRTFDPRWDAYRQYLPPAESESGG